MVHQVRIRLALLLALVLPATILSVPPSQADEPAGGLVVWAYDAVNGIRIIDICTSVTLPGETTPVEPVDGDYPVGTYDVLVESCDGTYKPVLFESVDVVASENTVLDAFMDLDDRAVVTGRVVDSYSGNPLKSMTVRLYALDGTPLDYTTTDRFGRYQIFAEPDVPVHVRFDDYSYRTYRRQWYPFTPSGNEAEAVTPHAGGHTVVHGALDVAGGFVGRFVASDDPAVPIPECLVRAWSGGVRSYSFSRPDGSFTVERTGNGVSVEVHCDGDDGGFLADPDHPSQVAYWNVGPGDSIDLGLIGMERAPAVSGRVVDQNGYPVAGAEVMFFAESDPATEYTTVGYTDALGYYVTNDPLDGRYTALVHFFAEQDGLTKMDHFNGTWLGNTADRGQALYLDFDGDNRGNVDFVVHRGERAEANLYDIESSGGMTVSTDRERDGATDEEPLEVSAYVEDPSYTILGTFYDPVPTYPGFHSYGFSSTVIYSPPQGSPPLAVDFTLEPTYLPDPTDDLEVVWNDRFLRSCDSFAPPCETDRATDARGDLVVSALVPSGGEASFVWGPSFLDTGDSTFRNDIEWLATEGVTKGCTPPVNDYFCPGDEVTRGQMAAFLVRFLGLTDRGTVDFTDDDGSVFEADIEKLATAGITKGCNPPANDRFCPNDPVTREQMAAFLTRALNLTAGSGTDFVDDNGSIFEDAIERLAAAGITRGCNPPTNDHFCPKTTVTREQMAAFLHRADTLRPGSAPASITTAAPAPTAQAVRPRSPFGTPSEMWGP
jgi:hypothetical protein